MPTIQGRRLQQFGERALCKSGIPQSVECKSGITQIAETVFPSMVGTPIMLISFAGPMEPPKQLDIRKEDAINWPTIKQGFKRIS